MLGVISRKHFVSADEDVYFLLSENELDPHCVSGGETFQTECGRLMGQLIFSLNQEFLKQEQNQRSEKGLQLC